MSAPRVLIYPESFYSYNCLPLASRDHGWPSRRRPQLELEWRRPVLYACRSVTPSARLPADAFPV